MQAPKPNENDVQDFNPLFRMIREKLEGFSDTVRVERIGGGQSNPTYFLETDEHSLVLRKRPAGVEIGSSHDVLREYRMMNALAGSGIPVPKVLFYSEDKSVVGTDFYVMEKVPSRQFFDGRLPELDALSRHQLYEDVATNLARLHRFDWSSSELVSYHRGGDFLQRQIDRWTGVFSGSDLLDEAQSVKRFLQSTKPETHALSLIHGDFKFSNFLIDPNVPRIAAVIDWELATIGDPLTDLAHTWASLWATTPDEYGGIMGVENDTSGIPSDSDFLDSYFRCNPIATELPVFYKVLTLFRYSSIFQGIQKRVKDGTAASSTAARVGALSDVYMNRTLRVMEEH